MGRGHSSSLQFLVSTFGSVSVSKGTDDLPDAVFRADAKGPHVPSFYDLCCSDVCVGGFCGDKYIGTALEGGDTNILLAETEEEITEEVAHLNLSRTLCKMASKRKISTGEDVQHSLTFPSSPYRSRGLNSHVVPPQAGPEQPQHQAHPCQRPHSLETVPEWETAMGANYSN